ncbi:hypothetical protein [Flavivirga algicola]|uniref:Uncharacterized protein n=1 Tax=Flavivirga algicola TaxID=2729136 RepID=A0ABX1RX83_9FLAO|nr:hypothetical protein [Flavivirga algicola]NMH87388.1 hypothetical protein [Flavivirga algicola]
MNLKNIIDNSGDSVLEEYFYSKGILTIALDVTELEKKIKIEIKTGDISFSNYYLEKKEELYRTCRIEIQELSSVLLVENSFYVPSKTFGKLMTESRLDYNLAYGKKNSDIKYIFSLVGYDRLVSCLLPDLNCITIEIET